MIRSPIGAIALVLLLLAGTAWAQEVGSIVEVAGTVELGRAGAWAEAQTGLAVHQGDEIRTGEPGKARILLRDESVLVLADASHLRIDQYVYDPNESTGSSLMRLLAGKLRSLVSDYYGGPHARYEVETKTAVAGVRGTEFVVFYDPATETTEVVGISGIVLVHSVLDRLGRGVFIRSQEVTYVPEGELPSPPSGLDEDIFERLLEDLELSALSTRLGIGITAAPVVAGESVAAPDRAPQVDLPAPDSLGTNPTVGDLLGQPPGVIQTRRGRLGIRF